MDVKETERFLLLFPPLRWKLLKSQIDEVILQRPEFDDQNRYEEVLWAVWNIRRKEVFESKIAIALWGDRKTAIHLIQKDVNYVVVAMRSAGSGASVRERRYGPIDVCKMAAQQVYVCFINLVQLEINSNGLTFIRRILLYGCSRVGSLRGPKI